MIVLTRLNGRQFWLNPHQIESIDINPDVTLLMLSGKKIIIKESPAEVIERIVEYRRRIGGFNNEE